MREIRIAVNNGIRHTPYTIGRQGEENVTKVVFDLADLVSMYGEGTAEMTVVRAGDRVPYVAETDYDGRYLSWTVGLADTQNAGEGEVQLTFMPDSGVKKTVIYPTVVERSIATGGTPPDPQKAWVDRMIELGQHVDESVEQAEESVQKASGFAEDAERYAAQAKESVAETIKFDEDGGNVTISLEV